MITQEAAGFPKADYDWQRVSVLCKDHQYGYAQEDQSLGWRFGAAVTYLNTYKARNDVPYQHFHLNPSLQERTLDDVFGHYGDPFTTPVAVAEEDDVSDSSG